MSSYVQVPPNRLNDDVLQALLEEFASRDGTDYGEVELTLDQKVDKLRHQLETEAVVIVFESQSEQWDLIAADQLETLLQD